MAVLQLKGGHLGSDCLPLKHELVHSLLKGHPQNLLVFELTRQGLDDGPGSGQQVLVVLILLLGGEALQVQVGGH